MFAGIQDFFINAGESSCYVLCLLKLAEKYQARKGIKKHFDVIAEMEKGINLRFINYNYKAVRDDNNFYVKRPDLFLSMLLDGKKVTVRMENAFYKAKNNELSVNYWQRKTPGKTYGHFNLDDWDSLLDSQTVKFGKIISKRIFTIE